MNIAKLKLDLIQCILSINDEQALVRVLKFMNESLPSERSSVSEGAVAYGMTEQELAELQEIERQQINGEDEYIPMDEAIRMAREALK